MLEGHPRGSGEGQQAQAATEKNVGRNGVPTEPRPLPLSLEEEKPRNNSAATLHSVLPAHTEHAQDNLYLCSERENINHLSTGQLLVHVHLCYVPFR